MEIALPHHDPTITPVAARALLRLIVNTAKQKQLNLPEFSPLE